MLRYNFKKQAIQEGLPWNEWSYYEKEIYRKKVRLENTRQDKIKSCKELLNQPNYQSDRLNLQAELDILENKMDIYDAFNHRINAAIQKYMEAIAINV